MTKVSANSNDEASSKDYIKNFSKRMLKTHLFIGTFQEQRFVEPLNSYRDVVKIDSDEKQFIENLVAVRKKLKQEFGKYPSKSPIWTGITEPDTIGAPVGYNLWVILPIEVFGTYWFKVKTVEFLESEVRVKLDVVRPLKNEKCVSDVSQAEDSKSFDLKTTVQDVSNNLRTNLLNFFKAYGTLTNIKASVIFIALLIGTIIAGGANIIKYLMEYLLKLMTEISGFIKVSTPIIISIINFFGKIINGLYGLIVTLLHGKPVRQPPVYNSYYSIDADNMSQFRDPRQRYNQYFKGRALPYRSSVTITPLDD